MIIYNQNSCQLVVFSTQYSAASAENLVSKGMRQLFFVTL